MRERIIQAIFDGWCDGSEINPMVHKAIATIAERFRAEEHDRSYIESQVTETICVCEKEAFRQGFYLCLELINGNIFVTE